MTGKRVVIVGGVAGGASVAARLRRLSETVHITMLERGEYVSFANCGLPYFVSGVIKEREALTIATPELFNERFEIDVRLGANVLSIDRAAKTIDVEEQGGAKRYALPYDTLVLATGAAPIMPRALPGVDAHAERIFALRTIPDADRIKAFIAKTRARRAVVVGAGFIGLELAENMHHLGLDVTLVEKAPHVLPPVDNEMAFILQRWLEARERFEVVVGDGIAAVEASHEPSAAALMLRLESGRALPGDLVLMCIGVTPESSLAVAAGLRQGLARTIAVTDTMHSPDDASIMALGDNCQVEDYVTRADTNVPLAGPAQRQGRLVAERIAAQLVAEGDAFDAAAPAPRAYRGTQATAVLGVFGLEVARTGESEASLDAQNERWRAAGDEARVIEYRSVWVHAGSHVSYYPGASRLHIKITFDARSGRLLGAQAVGAASVARRIDVASVFIQMRASVRDMADAELCYAPAFGSAKDPMNIAAMVAVNHLDGLSPLVSWRDVLAASSSLATATVVDVREPDEFAAPEGHVDGAHNVPLSVMRGDGLARVRALLEGKQDRRVLVYCRVGQRAHNAVRFLRCHGVDAYNLSGGYTTYEMMTKSTHFDIEH